MKSHLEIGYIINLKYSWVLYIGLNHMNTQKIIILENQTIFKKCINQRFRKFYRWIAPLKVFWMINIES